MQRLNHHHLFIFWQFSKHSSFTKTAAELGIAQSAVTLQVKQLEEVLDLKLVDRSNARRPEITEEGRKVAEYADSIFETSRELVNWATKGALPKKRSVRIGAISGLSRNFQYEFLEPILRQREVKFEIITGDQQNLLRRLKEHELDVVLSSQNASSTNKVNFHSSVLKASPLIFVIRNTVQHRANLDFAKMLSSSPIILPGRQFESKPELEAFLEPFKNLRIAGEVDDTALLRVLAVSSGFVVVIPEMGITSEIENQEVTVLHRLNKIQQKYYAITTERRHPNPDVRMLLDVIRKKM
jgi:LysR family transcriptional activator of nhaA